MEVDGSFGKHMEVNRNTWKSMEVDGIVLELEVFENRWKFMEVYGSGWKSMEVDGSV